MRIFLGMILGAILTIAAAYSSDVLTGRIGNSAAAAVDDRPMVNWEVVGRNWHDFEASVREMAQRVQDQWSKRS
jgi:hypothetical protein